MEKLLLRTNYVLFSWYYNRVPDHFKQWTFFKSVRLLIENYVHVERMYYMELRNVSTAMKEADSLRSQVQAYRWKELNVDPTTTMRLNGMFGTDMPTGNEN